MVNRTSMPVASAKTGTSPPVPASLYDRLISEGLAEADKHGGAVDHVTARRLAIWLNAQPQQRAFAEALAHFTRTGGLSRELVAELRLRARAANSPSHSQASRLLQYCASRGPDRGPIGKDFGAACDQVDQADAMLADARDRARNGIRPSPAPAFDMPAVTARASRGTASPTVTFTMDEATASIAIYAISAYAGEREAYARDMEQFSRALPEDSYGRHNRQAIAYREARAATRLRAIERAYQIAIGHAATTTPEPASTRTRADPGQAADRDMEME